jgi:hypothetical protein
MPSNRTAIVASHRKAAAPFADSDPRLREAFRTMNAAACVHGPGAMDAPTQARRPS